MSDMVLVKYVRNADDSVATGALTFHDDTDRPDLVIGGEGLVTPAELDRATALGVVLELVDDGLDASSADDIRQLADDLGIPTKVDGRPVKKEDLIPQIREARAAGPDVSALPPAAAVGPAGVAATEGSAAGPEGAPPAGPAGAGGGQA